MMAARRGIEGIVKLKVQVLPNGEAGLIELATSSGADVLDTSAIEQVRKWRFIPARRKNVAVTGWVIVPLVFELTR
jgi:protein TonB